ncbi:MAG: hypothetical protein QHH30_03560 [candidate division NC10 bacterium]|nr:hypothetical protein [candidate division NC10 bacterium]
MIYLIVLFSFLLRALPRLLHRDALVADTYFHLYCARVIAQNSFKIPARLPRVVLDHEYSYPFLYHLLLALFPPKLRAWAERLTGAIFDTANVVLIYLFSGWIVHQSDSPDLGHLPIWVAVLFAFSPALLRTGSGPRACNGSPRVMGQTLYLIHILSSLYGLFVGSLPALILALLAGAAMIVTAKFGTQVLLFFGAFFSLLLSFQYLWLLGGSLLFALLLSKGQAWKVIRGQVRHSRFYFQHLQRVFLYPHIPNLKQYAKGAGLHLWWLLRKGDLKGALEWFYTERHPLHLLITVYPQFLLVPFLLPRYGAVGFLQRFLLVWAASALFCFLATKTRPLLFLGEGERYLEYGLFPSLWLGVRFFLPRLEVVVWAFLAYSLLSAIYCLWSHLHRCREADEGFHRAERAFSELNRMPPGVILPIGSLHWQTLYGSDFPVLTLGGNVDERILPREQFLLVYGRYPYPSEEFTRILREYDVSYIVTDKAHLDYYLREILKSADDFYGRVKLLHGSPKLMIFQALKA